MDIELSEDERRAWDDLVALGREIQAPKKAAREAARLDGAKALQGDPKRSNKTDPSTWRRKVRGNIKGNSIGDVPAGVKRWLVARASGLSAKEASAISGTTWGEICRCNHISEEVRCAQDAMHHRSRMLMREESYSTLEQAVRVGGDVDGVAAKTALTVLERTDGEHFGDPRYRLQSTMAGQIATGGIVINLVDTSKPYVPPRIGENG